MIVPGSNLLVAALQAIGQQEVQWLKFLKREINQVGYDIAQYAESLAIKGSLQPVSRGLYQQYGLDYNKSYWNFYTPHDIGDVSRDSSGDQFIFKGRLYQCESITPWASIDGWTAVMAVDIGVAPRVSVYFGFGNGRANFSGGRFVEVWRGGEAVGFGNGRQSFNHGNFVNV